MQSLRHYNIFFNGAQHGTAPRWAPKQNHLYLSVTNQIQLKVATDMSYLFLRDWCPFDAVCSVWLVNIVSKTFLFQVITSKQRPRRLCVRGSNGKDYMFLLKGHEDLRQDERVMQLFGLVNTLLQADPDTFRRDLAIQRYAVIPLSTNSGLIGWVPHCDTLHSLIRDYREKRKCLLNIEHRIMQRMASDLERLMLMQKVGEDFPYISLECIISLFDRPCRL